MPSVPTIPECDLDLVFPAEYNLQGCTMMWLNEQNRSFTRGGRLGCRFQGLGLGFLYLHIQNVTVKHLTASLPYSPPSSLLLLFKILLDANVL